MVGMHFGPNEGLPYVLTLIPYPNTFTGFLAYVLIGYIFILLSGWITGSSFDKMPDYRNMYAAKQAEKTKKDE
jgi:hypothetical protein